jgi:hypothetical protein
MKKFLLVCLIAGALAWVAAHSLADAFGATNAAHIARIN